MDILGTEKMIFSFLLLLPVIAASGPYEYTCGDFTSENISYFVNPMETPFFCFLEVTVKNSRVTQLRLDFERFTLEQPTAYEDPPLIFPFPAYFCNNDNFTVSSPSTGGTRNIGFDNLCGENSGQHIYVPVNATNGSASVELAFHLADRTQNTGLIHPQWRIRITQIDCCAPDTKDLCAPAGCLQYYLDRTGTFESFNYNNGSGHYQGFLHYAICFKRYDGICSIEYSPVFHPAASSFHLAAENLGAPYGSAGCYAYATDPSLPGTTDYLFIPDGRFADGTTESLFCGDYLSTKSVGTNAPGTMFVLFSTDNTANELALGPEIGFRLRYSQSRSGCVRKIG